MKILLSNFGYGLGIAGRKLEYLRHGYKTFSSPKSQHQSLELLAKTIYESDADITCVSEIHKTDQIAYLKELLPGYHIFSHTKYEPSDTLSRRLYGAKRSNALICKDNCHFSTRYLKSGAKKLIYIVELSDDTNMYFGHFSLSKKVREKQFFELSEWILESKKKAVVCGDFNCFSGVQELDSLSQSGKLRCITESPTFPSYNPRYRLDLFFVSNSIDGHSHVLDVEFSDHLPVLAHLNI